MPTEIVIQTGAHPGRILTALDSIATPETTRLRVAVAYATKPGVHLVFAHLRQQVGPRWEKIPKQIVVSLDFGFTQPTALLALLDVPQLELRVADPSVIARPMFAPMVPFHPKLYIVHRQADAHVLVGSANLSAPAFSVSTEAVAVVREHSEIQPIEVSWAEIWNGASPATPQLVSDYGNQWSVVPQTVSPDPPIPDPAFNAPPNYLWAAMEAGFNPAHFQNFWVEAGSMSSSAAHNQLELPRGANWFFGFNFSDYQHGDTATPIGTPTFKARGNVWQDRLLKWHSHNMMERLNLPTLNQGGYDYAGCIVLFSRRSDGSFHIRVAPAGSAPVAGWELNSLANQALLGVGPTSNRRCGFF